MHTLLYFTHFTHVKLNAVYFYDKQNNKSFKTTEVILILRFSEVRVRAD